MISHDAEQTPTGSRSPNSVYACTHMITTRTQEL